MNEGIIYLTIHHSPYVDVKAKAFDDKNDLVVWLKKKHKVRVAKFNRDEFVEHYGFDLTYYPKRFEKALEILKQYDEVVEVFIERERDFFSTEQVKSEYQVVMECERDFYYKVVLDYNNAVDILNHPEKLPEHKRDESVKKIKHACVHLEWKIPNPIYSKHKTTIDKMRNEGKTYKEISKHVGLSVQRVRVINLSDRKDLSTRAINTLREVLGVEPTKENIITSFNSDGICFVNQLKRCRNLGKKTINEICEYAGYDQYRIKRTRYKTCPKCCGKINIVTNMHV